MAEIQLIATDLDGTLIGSVNEFPLYGDFRNRIEQLRRSHGAVWTVCTGRSLASFKDFMSPMRTMAIVPEFAIINHAYIYEKMGNSYIPHLLWNLKIFYMQYAARIRLHGAIDEWHEFIARMSHGVTTIRKRTDRLWLRFDSEESSKVAAGILRGKAKDFRQLQVFEYLREVDVRTVPYTKGLALSELAKRISISREHILAIGNGHNDISMFAPSVALMTGCPCNSEPEVIEYVHKSGGHISKARSLAGVMDILDAHFSDKVDNSLPDGWKLPTENSNPHRPSKRRRKPSFSWKHKILVAAVAYTILLIFANFNLIPFVSGLIMLPFRLGLKLLEKIMIIVLQMLPPG